MHCLLKVNGFTRKFDIDLVFAPCMSQSLPCGIYDSKPHDFPRPHSHPFPSQESPYAARYDDHSSASHDDTEFSEEFILLSPTSPQYYSEDTGMTLHSFTTVCICSMNLGSVT